MTMKIILLFTLVLLVVFPLQSQAVCQTRWEMIFSGEAIEFGPSPGFSFDLSLARSENNKGEHE